MGHVMVVAPGMCDTVGIMMPYFGAYNVYEYNNVSLYDNAIEIIYQPSIQ